MKKKNVLALALACTASFSLFACEDSTAEEKDVVGERVSQEVFSKAMIDGVCCENLSYRMPLNETSTSTYDGKTYTITSTGDRFIKRAGNVISDQTKVTVVTETSTTDAETGETVTERTETVSDKTVYYEMVGETCYEYTYNETTEKWSKAESSFGALLWSNGYDFISPDGGDSSNAISEMIIYLCNMENWTFNETTGVYELRGYEVDYSDSIKFTCDYDYKFKDGHILYVKCSAKYIGSILDGFEMVQEYYYYDHGKTSITLPTVQEEPPLEESPEENTGENSEAA